MHHVDALLWLRQSLGKSFISCEIISISSKTFSLFQVDDDNTHYAEDYNQPGLAQDANVFLGGEPGGKYVGSLGHGIFRNRKVSILETKGSLQKKTVYFMTTC